MVHRYNIKSAKLLNKLNRIPSIIDPIPIPIPIPIHYSVNAITSSVSVGTQALSTLTTLRW